MSLNGKVENSIANNDVEEGFFFIALLSSCIVLPQVKEKKLYDSSLYPAHGYIILFT